jgi:hypothetical protein
MPWGVAAAAIAGGAISAIGSGAAASEEAGAANNSTAAQQQEFNTITQQETPYMESGYGALGDLNYLLGVSPTTATGQNPNQNGSVSTPYSVPGLGMGALGGSGIPIGSTSTGSQYQPTTSSAAGGFGSLVQPFTTADWQQLSPMYNFELQQGEQGVLNADNTTIGAMSGASLKDLISFNQGTANQSFNNAYNMYQQQQGNIYNRLYSLAGLGQTSAANTGQQGTTLAGNIGQSEIAAGNAIGSGISSGANALGNSANAYAAYASLNQSPNFQLDSSISGDNGNALLTAAGGGP